MKNSWLVWIFVVGVVVTMLIAFNYQGAQDTVPLSEIFPDTETYPVEIEFVDEDSQPTDTVQELAVEATEKVTEEIKLTTKAADTLVKSPIAIIKEKPIAKAPQKPVNLNDFKYTIQVASFKDKGKAEKKLTELEKKDYKAFLVSKDLKGKGTWHRVYVGKFGTKNEANQFLTRVKQDYASSFVISPRK